MSAVPARQSPTGPGQMLAEGTKEEIRAICVKTGGVALRGNRLPDGRLRVQIVLPAAGPGVRWWQGRSWKFWTPIAAGGLAMFAGMLWAFVLVMQALIAGVVAVLTAALGALVILGAVALLSAARVGGKWTGSGTWQ